MATGELVEEVAVEVADHLEDVADATRHINARELGLVLSGLGGGLVSGAVAGFYYAKRKLELKYHEIAEEEIAQYRQHYYQKIRAAEHEEEKAKLKEVVQDEGYTPYSDVEPKSAPDQSGAQEPVVVKTPAPATRTNVFEIPEPETPEWDQDAEEKDRSSTQPYIIHRDEYRLNHKKYDQKTLAYYADDDVLVNDEDRPIHTTEGLVPSDFAERFGHGSGDPNVVYVRCDEVACEFEIIRNDGNFAEVVHGFLKHSDERGRRARPRFDDD